jgi:predicted nucleotidyltransferase component of viral defense system
MIQWLKLPDERKTQLLNQAAVKTRFLAHAIEKDWWVTLALRAVFSTKWQNNLVFKGGTSLSKAWGLVERFSEDVDLALDRKVLGFPETFVSNAQIRKLRKKASEFIVSEFLCELEHTLIEMGISTDQFELSLQETEIEDKDPQVIELGYHSALEPDAYITDWVLIEIGARSLREPSSEREIKTILHDLFPGQSFGGAPFFVPTVDPKRTFLEKAFLLHEEFQKPTEKIRTTRLSRHLYDLEKLMDTEHAVAALEDHHFYSAIVDHRQKFNAIRGIDYTLHSPSHINFIPPEVVMGQWQNDYAEMRRSMIYGKSIEFTELMARLLDLKQRFRKMQYPRPAA